MHVCSVSKRVRFHLARSYCLQRGNRLGAFRIIQVLRGAHKSHKGWHMRPIRARSSLHALIHGLARCPSIVSKPSLLLPFPTRPFSVSRVILDRGCRVGHLGQARVLSLGGAQDGPSRSLRKGAAGCGAQVAEPGRRGEDGNTYRLC